MMKGTVLRYEEPFEPVAPPSDRSASAVILLDTHALIWAAEGNRRLGETARATIEETRRERPRRGR